MPAAKRQTIKCDARQSGKRVICSWKLNGKDITLSALKAKRGVDSDRLARLKQNALNRLAAAGAKTAPAPRSTKRATCKLSRTGDSCSYYIGTKRVTRDYLMHEKDYTEKQLDALRKRARGSAIRRAVKARSKSPKRKSRSTTKRKSRSPVRKRSTTKRKSRSPVRKRRGSRSWADLNNYARFLKAVYQIDDYSKQLERLKDIQTKGRALGDAYRDGKFSTKIKKTMTLAEVKKLVRDAKLKF